MDPQSRELEDSLLCLQYVEEVLRIAVLGRKLFHLMVLLQDMAGHSLD